MDMMTIATTALGFVFAIAMFLLKRLLNRVDEIESQVDKMITEEQVRVIVNDKIDPLRDRLKALEHKLDQIINILVNNK